MTDTRDMLGASPTGVPLGADDVAAAIDACLNCLQACTSCADSDLVEADVEMMRKGLERAGITAGPSPRFRPKDAVLRLLESR